MLQRVYIVGACRTPIGKMGGALKDVDAATLGALVVREALARARVPADCVDHVTMGCVLQAGLGQNMARQAALQAGLPVKTTAQTLNIVCGSGLESVNEAARRIQCGDADIVVAGGAESMSRAPFAISEARFGTRMGWPMRSSQMVDLMVQDALWDAFNDYHMGVTAENIAREYGISRAEQDAFAAESQRKACRAMARSAFRAETVPVPLPSPKGQTLFDTDEAPRADATPEKLARLKPVFLEGGTVTVGNASGLNDGAAAVVLASETALQKLGLTPLAQWLGSALSGTEPAMMGMGPVSAVQKVLQKFGGTITEIDLAEINEAFAAQALAVTRALHIPPEKLNVNGGAIALGHPVGASGCRILVTLLHAMQERGARLGLAALCIGGGMGCAAVIQRG